MFQLELLSGVVVLFLQLAWWYFPIVFLLSEVINQIFLSLSQIFIWVDFVTYELNKHLRNIILEIVLGSVVVFLVLIFKLLLV